MTKCNPEEMAKNLKAVDIMRDAGVDFVPIPVSKKVSKAELLGLMASQFVELEAEQTGSKA